MRFLSMIRLQENTGQVPSEQLVTDMGKLIEEWTKAGILVRTAGLKPTKDGVRVRSRHGKMSTTDGPFTEAKEVIGGFAIYELPSKAEMIKLTREFLQMQNDIWPDWEGEVEIRQMWDDSPDSANQG